MSDLKQGRAFFPALDAIRGLAALMVVMHHNKGLVGFALPRGYLAVDLFFALSGIVVANAYEAKLLSSMTTGRFAYVRIVRLYPLYLVGLLLGVLGALLVQNPLLQGVGVTTALMFGLFLIPHIGAMGHGAGQSAIMYPLNLPAWSLLLELIINFVYAAVVSHLTTKRLVGVVLGSGVLLIAMTIVSPAHDLNFGFRLTQIPLGLVRTCFSFSMGVLIFRKMPDLLRLAPMLPRWPTTAILLLIVTTVLSFTPEGILANIYDPLCAMLIFPAILCCALHLSYGARTMRFFAFLGTASYSIYVTHWPCAAILRAVLNFLQLPIVTPWTGIAYIMGLLILAYVLDRWFDMPIREYLRNRGKERRMVEASSPAS